VDRVTALRSLPRGSVLQPGRAWPLGAQPRDGGVNFAVFSGHALGIELCLFDAADPDREIMRLPLPGHTGDVFHGFLPGAEAGLVYGLRAHGHWLPQRGHRFNTHKLLLDPWGREIVVPATGFSWHGPHCGHDPQHPGHLDARDNARWALKSRVVAPGSEGFDWQGSTHPRTPLAATVLYELHVRSFTKCLPGVPEPLRGTYAGLAHEAALAHLQRLGVTAVSLLPVQQLLSEARLVHHGLVNHWGYNTLGFFCPEPRYAAAATPAGARQEFRSLVRRLHAAGIEVIMDVVYNHSCEGDERGATLCWRGLDNAGYYRLRPDAREHCENWTGCGNTFKMHHPRVLQMVLDSLRHWVQDYQVDGFRFDLAPVLGRGAHDFEREGAFFKALQQDPVLAGCKLIAEPWDIGPGGYQVGNFPPGWLEWNDKFRDTTRAFWLGGDCTRGEFALRLAGSSDLYQARQRSPLESVNYVVSHDGFTLHDLVSYDFKHNEANLEDNRDGHGHNLSWNCGWEGPTTDPAVLALRARLKRALLATALLAQGTPMLAAGDELGHTQQGNNNPYCQDNALTWIDWARADQSLIDFTAHVLALRRRLLPLGTLWYSGIADSQGLADLAWLRRIGEPMAPQHWDNRMSRIMGAWIGKPGGGGAPLLLMINGRDMDASFMLPPGGWVAELDTTRANGQSDWRREPGAPGDDPYLLSARSLMLLRALHPRSSDDASTGSLPAPGAPTGSAP
jgi:glycogen operon protein